MALQSTTGDKHWKPNASTNFLARDKITARRYIGFARSNCRDAQGIYWGARYNLLKNIKVPGQTRLERKDMAAKLKRHGLLDRSEYETIKMCNKVAQVLT